MSVKFKKFDHILTEQYQAEKKILDACAAGAFTLEHPYVAVNPYLIAPLTALVHFRIAAPVTANTHWRTAK